MKPEFVDGNVRARCPDCDGALTTFESRSAGAGEYGYIIINERHEFENLSWERTIFQLTRCAGCGRAGLAELHCNNNVFEGKLGDFYPHTIDTASIPDTVPQGISTEYREAELCASVGAWRGASALLRSVLEKTLETNGYVKGSLQTRIDEAASDGVITGARSRRAHQDIRVLGNDVLHDEWREVTPEEVDASHKYAQRILEDLYDDREAVETLLREVGRLKEAESGESIDEPEGTNG